VPNATTIAKTTNPKAIAFADRTIVWLKIPKRPAKGDSRFKV